MPKDFPKQGSTVFKSTLQRLSAKAGLCITCMNTSGVSGLSENLPRNFLLNGSRILRTLFLYTDLGKTDKQYLKTRNKEPAGNLRRENGRLEGTPGR